MDSMLQQFAFCVRENTQEFYKNHFSPGTYVCAACEKPLFSSQAKYEHPTPWPAFSQPISEDAVKRLPEPDDPNALKLLCGACGHPLGHEFLRDGPTDGASRF